jgi:hypothetical protein
MQTSIRPPPGFTSAQIFLMSSPQAFPIASALTRTAWHGAERPLKCDLMQALMRPSSRCTPAHSDLTSVAHCAAIGCCAIALVADSSTMAPIARIFFSIVWSLISSLHLCAAILVQLFSTFDHFRRLRPRTGSLQTRSAEMTRVEPSFPPSCGASSPGIEVAI